MYTIGLTGRAESGKTFAQTVLETHFNLTIIDLDILGHVLLNRPPIQLELQRTFGRDVVNLDGTVNRAVLGEKVFKDKTQLQALNKIMHPKMKEMVISLIASSTKPSVIVGALLPEIDLIDLCDVIVTISADETGIDPTSKRYSILKNQRSIDDYEKNADYILNNSYTPLFQNDVLSLFRSLLKT